MKRLLSVRTTLSFLPKIPSVIMGRRWKEDMFYGSRKRRQWGFWKTLWSIIDLEWLIRRSTLAYEPPDMKEESPFYAQLRKAEVEEYKMIMDGKGEPHMFEALFQRTRNMEALFSRYQICARLNWLPESVAQWLTVHAPRYLLPRYDRAFWERVSGNA